MGGASSWLIALACTHCGAQGKFLGDQLIAICDYCGHIISAHRALAAGHENIALAECRSFVVPTLTDVRRLELADIKYAAIEARDAAVVHAATCELAALDAMDAGLPADQAATWARWSAAIERVATFSTAASFQPAVDRFTADPADYAAEMLAGYTRTYRDLVSAPEFPVELATAIPPEVAAMDAFLALLRSWVMFAPFDAITRALIALGQRPLYAANAPVPCRTCGAPITASALAELACAFCRAAIEVRRHIWLDGLLRTVAMANADTLVPDERAAAALGMLTAAARVPGNAIPEHVIAEYLGAVDGVERGAMTSMSALMLEHHSLGAGERTVLLVAQRHFDRVPVSVPPAPGRRAGSFIALAPSEAWQRAAIRNWKRMLRYSPGLERDAHIGLIAANQLLPPLAGGYLPDAGDAAAFLRATGVAAASIRDALALHATGESDPDKGAFWNATAALL